MKINYKKIFITLALGLYCLSAKQLMANDIYSGIYDQFIIAKTSDDRIQGYFYDESYSTFKCKFFFEGKIKNEAKIVINSWLEDSHSGIIEANKERINIVIDNARDYPGCMNFLLPQISTTGMEFELSAKKEWIELVIIKSQKAVLKGQNNSQNKRNAYLVKNDVVGVLQYNAHSAKVEYINNSGKSFIGWIDNNEFEHLKNPKTE